MPFTLKNIYDAIREVKISGHQVSELEALLVHRDDLKELFASESRLQTGMSASDDGGLKLYGIKIVDSYYTQRGTIFKIFKNGNSWAKSYGPFKMPDCFPVVPKTGLTYVPKPSPLPAVPKKPEKKHSPKRRIELD